MNLNLYVGFIAVASYAMEVEEVGVLSGQIVLPDDSQEETKP